MDDEYIAHVIGPAATSDGPYYGGLKDGSPHGYGRKEMTRIGTTCTYEGQWLNGTATGNGVMTFSNGLRYEGGFRNGNFEGNGKAAYPNGLVYEGGFRNDEFEGYGVLTRSDGTRYEGDFRNDMYEGHGVLTVDDTRYEGDFRNGKFEGHGVLAFSHGMRYEGDFGNGRFEGHGVLTFSDGTRYEGDFRNGRYEGCGVLTDPNNGTRYDGAFRNGMYDGSGVFTSPNGNKLHGMWQRNELKGRILTKDRSGRSLVYYMLSVEQQAFLNVVGLKDLSEDSPTECCICMNAFVDSDVIVSTKCKHVFHESCGSAWLLKNGTCPLCRTHILSVDTSDGEEEL